MRVLLFSDIHSDLKSLERLIAVEADAYVCAGDLVSWARGLDAAGEVMRPKAERVWVLPGNHESAADMEGLCERFGFRNLHEKVELWGRWLVAGLGYSNRTPFDTPGEFTEEEIATRLAAFAGLEPLVLVCHCPPKGTALDWTPGGHFGSTAVASFVQREQPHWLFCGHIHEAEGATERLGRTMGVNVGKRGYVVELG